MAKSIDEYKKDYADARARGDAAGMQAANSGANAIRRQRGVTEEYAGVDIGKVAAKSGGASGGGVTSSSGGGTVSGVGSGGGGTSVYKSPPGGFLGSATGVGVYDGDQQSVKDQMNANSQAWWKTTDTAERARLERENQSLGAFLGGSVGYDAGTGTWSGDAAQKLPGPQYTGWGSYDDFYKNNGYGSISAAEQAAIDAYIKQAINNLEGQRSGIGQSADDAARQAYVSYMRSLNTLPQALAASGYTGGMAESQRLGLETALQGSQTDITLNRDNAINALDTAINNTKLEGSIQGAQTQAQLGRDAMSAYQAYVNQKNAMASQDYWNRYGFDFQAGQTMQNQNWQSGEAEKDRTMTGGQQSWGQVMNLLQAGLMPTDDMLAAAGVDKATAQAWLETLRGQTLPKAGTSGRVDAGTVKNPAPDDDLSQGRYDEAANRFDGGDYSPEVLDILVAAGDSPGMLAAQAGYGNAEKLGYGAISEVALAQKVQSGEVQVMSIGGRLFYKRVQSALPSGKEPPKWPAWADPTTW